MGTINEYISDKKFLSKKQLLKKYILNPESILTIIIFVVVNFFIIRESIYVLYYEPKFNDNVKLICNSAINRANNDIYESGEENITYCNNLNISFKDDTTYCINISGDNLINSFEVENSKLKFSISNKYIKDCNDIDTKHASRK